MWDMDWESAGIGLLLGLLLGRLWAGWAVWGYVKSKRPDKHGFRTGIHLGDGMYYIATGEEYLHMMDQEQARVQKDRSRFTGLPHRR